MDVKAELLSQLEQIEKDKAEIVTAKAELAIQRLAVEESAKQLEQKKADAIKAVADAGGLDAIEKMRIEYIGKVAEATEEVDSQKNKKIVLIKWENRLVDIEAAQKQEAEKLTRAKEELEEEKKTYKEKLKAEFLEALKRQMPQ